MYRHRCLRCSLLELSLLRRLLPSSRRSTTFTDGAIEKPIVPSKPYFPPPASKARDPKHPSKPLTRGGHISKPPHLRPKYMRYRRAVDGAIQNAEKEFPDE